MSHNSMAEMFRRMGFGTSPAIVLLTIVSTGLVAVAAYFWSVVDHLRIPITPGLPEVATFLPVVNFMAMRYLTKAPRGQQRGAPEWSLKAGIMAILLVMIDTFVVTQAINNIPMSSISCPLEKTWHSYFNRKDENTIRTIQNALNCCGLKTTKEQPWPFPHYDKDHPQKNIPATFCSDTFKRTTACFGPWSQKHQLSAGMFMIVGVATLLSKAIIFAVYRRRAHSQSRGTQRLIDSGANNGASNDTEGSASHITGLRLRPDERIRFPENDDDVESVVDENSRLLEHNNEGSQYEGSRLLEEGGGSILPSGDESIWRSEHSRANPLK